MYNPNSGVPHQQMQQQPQHQLAGVAGHIISPLNPANIFVQTPAHPPHRFPVPPITFMNGNVGENHEAFQVMSPPTAPNLNPYNDTEYAIGGNQTVPSNETSKDGYNLPAAVNTEKILTQLKYYLSQENLAKDTFLTNNMEPDGFVPIHIIASFRRIVELTNDLDVKKRVALVTNILKGTDFAEVDFKGERVRPIIQDTAPSQRTKLLVRNVPEGVDSTELTQLFEMQEGCPSSTGVEKIGKDLWYVSFATEQDTLIVHNLISQATLKCRGQHLNACIKSHTMTTRPAVITAAAVTAALEIVEALPQQQRIEVVAPPPQRFEGPPPRFDVLPPQRVEVAQTQRFEATQTQRIDATQPRFEAAFQPQRVEIAQSRIYDSPQRFEGPPQPSRYEPPQLHRFEAPQPTHGRFETSTQPHSRFEGPPRLAEIIHRQEIPRLENFQRSEPRSAEVPVLSRQPFYPQPAGLAPVRHPYNQQTRIIVPFHPTQQSFMGQNYQLPPTAVLGTYPSQLWAQPPQSQFLVTDMNGAVIQIQNCQPQIYPQLQQMIATDPTRIYGIQAARPRTQFVQMQQSNFLPQQIYPPPRSRRDSNGHHEFKRPDRSSYPARQHTRPNSGGSRVEYGHFAANQLSEQSGMSASAVDINKITPSVAVSADQSFSDGQSVDDIRSEANSVIGNAEDQPDITMTSGGGSVEPQWQSTPATTVGVAAAHISSSGAAVYTANDGHATSSSSWQRGPGGRDAPLPQRYNQGANRGNKRSNRNYEDTNYRFNNRGKTQPVSEPQFDFERDSFSFPTLKETLQTAALPGSTPTTAAHDSASEGSERLARPPSMLSSTQMTPTSAVAQPEVPSVGNSLATNPDNSVTSSAPQLDSTPGSNAVDNNGNKESMSNTSAKPSYAQIAQKGKHPSSDETILVNDERSGEPAVIRETSGYNGLDGGSANPVQNRFSPEQDSRRPVQDYNGYNRRGSGRGRGGRGVFYNSSRVYRD